MKIKKPWVSWEEFNEFLSGGPVTGHTHVKIDITNTPWAWADVLKTGSNLTDLATRQHAGLTNITSGQHHAQLHAASHHVAGADLLAFASITGFGTYLDQAVKQASSPTHVTAKLTGLTDGYVPYHVSDAVGLANSPIFTNGTNIGLWTATPGANLDLDKGLGAGATMRLRGNAPKGIYHGYRTEGIGFAITAFDFRFQNDVETAELIKLGVYGTTHLGGTPTLNYLWIGDAYNDTAFRIYPDKNTYFDGNVGIKKAPTCELDVDGTIKATEFYLNLGGLLDVNLNKYQTAAAYDILTRNSDGDWCAQEIETVVYKWPFKSVEIKNECMNISAGYNAPWNQAAMGSGGISLDAGISDHPGIYRFYSGASGTNGYYMITPTTGMVLNGEEQADFVFKTTNEVDFTGHYVRIGFQNSTAGTAPTNAVMVFWSNDANLYGRTTNGGTSSTTGTYYTMSVSTWYRARIIVNSTKTQIDFYLYSMGGTELWHQLLTTNIPTGTMGHGIIAYGVGDVGNPVWLDYMDYIVARGLARG